MQRGKAELESALLAAGIAVGCCKPWLVDDIRCVTKADLNKEIAPSPRTDETPDAPDDRLIRFAVVKTADGAPAFRSMLEFAQCPLFVLETAMVDMQEECTVQQRRAHPSYNSDGTVEHFRDTKAWQTETAPQRKLVTNASVIAVAFFSHSWIAQHQAEMFDMCADKLPADSIAVLIDYSMNYSHGHLNEDQSDFWSAYQSTVLPVVVYMRSKSGKVTWAHSHVYISADLVHSNAFVQHVMDDILKKYKAVFHELLDEPSSTATSGATAAAASSRTRTSSTG